MITFKLLIVQTHMDIDIEEMLIGQRFLSRANRPPLAKLLSLLYQLLVFTGCFNRAHGQKPSRILKPQFPGAGVVKVSLGEIHHGNLQIPHNALDIVTKCLFCTF